jgi:hypothetical protein
LNRSEPWQRAINRRVRHLKSATLSNHVMVVITCCAGIASAQIPLDPALVDMAAKMQPGQSIVRGDSKLTLHQRHAGIKDANGWFLAKSAQGGFSARFPAPFNDETYSTKAEDGTQIEQNILTSETSTTRFMVTCMKQNKFAVSAETVDQIVKMIASASEHFKSEHFTSGRLEGAQYSGIDAKGTYFAGQSFLLGNQFCQFLVGSHTPFEGIPPDIRASFASFRPTDRKKQ